MKSFSYIIKNPQGLHARIVGLVAAEALKCESTVKIRSGERSAEGKDLIGLMGLCAACGDPLEVEISGRDEGEIYEKIKRIMEENL